jgi:hypothetical protein
MPRAIDFEPLAFQHCSVFAGSRQIGSQLHTGETEMLTEDQFAKLINSQNEVVNNLRAEKAALATLDAKPFPKTLNRWSLGPQLEFWSSVLSIGCLAYTLYIWTRGTANVRLTQEILLYTNELQLTNAMRHLQVEYNAWCNKKFRMDLEVPTWDPKNVERNGFDVTFSNRGVDAGILQGISTSIDVHYTTIDLFYVSIPIFVLSALFQNARYRNYCTSDNPGGWYKPWLGPEFSLWVEYFCTSTLQIFIVSVAFGTTNISTLLGQCGMQATLVLFGYDIEKQIKKIYNRNHVESRAQDYYTKAGADYQQNIYQFPTKKRFHHILWNRTDLRLWVYVGVSWLLHALIWSSILGRFYQQERQGELCEKNEDFRMPNAVTFLVWSQFVLFTSFGVVSTLQVVYAKPLPYNSVQINDQGRVDWQQYDGKLQGKHTPSCVFSLTDNG